MNDHLAERYGPPVRNESVPLEPWTPDEQQAHRDQLEADLYARQRRVQRNRAAVVAAISRPCRPSPTTVDAIIDDLPPDSRDHTVIVRGAS